jgi:hypothetical protein
MDNLILRGGTKTQRLAKNNCFLFFAPSWTLSRVGGMKCFCDSGDFFTPSLGQGQVRKA